MTTYVAEVTYTDDDFTEIVRGYKTLLVREGCFTFIWCDEKETSLIVPCTSVKTISSRKEE